MTKTTKTLELAGKQFTFDTGELAQQATISVLAHQGDTTVLTTIVEGRDREDLGYFPLSVEYVERLYAGGRIKGSRWVKREGRPSDQAVLTGRLIDRSIRPLFPKEFKKEVQVVVTVLSVDGENEPDILALMSVSLGLSLSKIPWKGPVGAVRIGLVKEPQGANIEYIVNPTSSELALSELDMVATQTMDKTLMLEAGALQVSEEVVYKAIEKAQEENIKIIEFINAWVKEAGTPKEEVKIDPVYNELLQTIEKNYKKEITDLIPLRAHKESTSGGETDALINTIFEFIHGEDPQSGIDKKMIAKALEYVFFQAIRGQAVSKKQRPDGRKVDEVRPISSRVSLLPRTHGSALFQRGDTQALVIATLGAPRMEQLIESAEGEESKRYIHHYSMPPYSVGEAGRMGVPSRREIGHGALAERALEAVIPAKDKFPYTIRVVTEVLSSNGSTSMAATCGSTLALMDAGVPILKPVSGIAMGMMSSDTEYVILTDIIGLEDFSGDMDFKVAGTDTGITAIQLDVKKPITLAQVKETIDRARIGRLHIMEKMLSPLPESRNQISEYAPKIELVHIPVEKIGEIIGPGGRIIKNIIATTGAAVDVEDDGTVTISSTNQESVTKAVDWISGLTREVHAGEVFEDGTVKRILPFGAFVEFLPGKEGMVHVSQMAAGFVKNPNDVVHIGDKVKVRVMEIDDQGRINLSMKFGEDAEGDKGGNRGGNRSEPERQPEMHVEPQPQPVAVRQPRFSPSNTAPVDAKPPHPLTMQFRRERSAAQPGGFRRRSGPGRPASGGSRFGGPSRSGGTGGNNRPSR